MRIDQQPSFAPVKATAAQSERAESVEKIAAQSRAKSPVYDTVTLSRKKADREALSPEEREKQERKAFLEEQKAAKAQAEEMRQQIKAADAQAKAAGDTMKKLGKCLTIAMRIMSGDEVPQEDHHFLLENSPELYMRAVSMRIQKEDPKKYKRLSEDEEPAATAPGSPSAAPEMEATEAPVTEAPPMEA